ncbi:MAG TPA: hypothetical protein VGG74_11780 [Kofleriaceae bacterium]|jgi:hypothetical protein
MTTTTADAIRDRIIAVIAALAPTSLPDRFAPFRNEEAADFATWASQNADAAWRRFQVRDTGDYTPPAVSNTDVSEEIVTFAIYVAYPQTSRGGAKNALDRDRVMKEDQRQIDEAVGLGGAANFTDPFPNASWRGSKTTRKVVAGVDMLVVTQTMGFWQAAI